MGMVMKQIREYEDMLYFDKFKNEEEKKQIESILEDLTAKRDQIFSNKNTGEPSADSLTEQLTKKFPKNRPDLKV